MVGDRVGDLNNIEGIREFISNLNISTQSDIILTIEGERDGSLVGF